MASIWKNPRSRFFVACFTSADGRQLKRSTKSTDRRQAQRIAEQFEAEYSKRRTSDQMRKVLQEIHREITGETIEDTSLEKYAETWIEKKRGEGCTETTIKSYQAALKRFLIFVGGKAGGSIHSITRQDVEAFRNSLIGHRATKTISHGLRCLRLFFSTAKIDLALGTNPAETVKISGSNIDQRKAAFSHEQLTTLVRFVDGEWLTMVLLGVYTGQRMGDLQSLRWDAVNWAEESLRIWNRKTSKAVNVPMATPLKRHLRSLQQGAGGSDFLVPKLASYAVNSLSGQFSDILIACGLKVEAPPVKGPRSNLGLSFHSLRHSTVTLLKGAGVPAAAVQALVGHDSVKMSEHYSHVGTDALRDAASKLPDFEAPP